MTDTIAYITDTHLGGTGPGFFQQPRRADLLEEICHGLRERLATLRVDLVVHGGDLVDRVTPERVLRALEMLAAFDRPVAACLGNHDLAAREAFDTWRARAPEAARVSWADGVVSLKHVDVVLANTAWMHEGHPGRYWDPEAGGCTEAVLPETLEWLEARLAAQPDRPAMLVMHAPLDEVPARLTGGEPIHIPQEPYARALGALLDRHSRVKAVFGAHNHVTSVARYGTRVHVNTSSLIEPPFEFRLVRFDEHSLHIETLAALEPPAGVEYIREKEWVNGFAFDRTVIAYW